MVLVEVREKMAVTCFLSCMSGLVMAQKLLTAGVTDTVHFVNIISAMAKAAGAN